MKILYFTQLFYPLLYGGGEYLFFMLARELARRGNEVHVITQMVRGTDRLEEYQRIKIHRIGSEVPYEGTLPPTIRSNVDYLLHSTLEGRRLIRQAISERHPFHIIHSNTYTPALSGHICATLYGIPDLVTFHDVYQASNAKFWAEWMSKLSEGFPVPASFMAKLLERIILRLHVSGFHTVSEASREDLVRFGVDSGRISVITNGIDQTDYDKIEAATRSDPPSAVFVGRLVFYKNLETVIQAFMNVVRAIPDAQLEILGDGPNREKLMREAEPIRANVHFAGRVSQEEKIRTIKQSSFMVFPSILEGFGISAIEAFACRKPVLVSDVRPLSDIVIHGRDGYVISPFNVSEWSKRMTELFEDPSKASKMGDDALEDFSAKYQLPLMVSRLERLYQDLSHARAMSLREVARKTETPS
jgi:glycosyltransferase involved in cell wall biosynthesis